MNELEATTVGQTRLVFSHMGDSSYGDTAPPTEN